MENRRLDSKFLRLPGPTWETVRSSGYSWKKLKNVNDFASCNDNTMTRLWQSCEEVLACKWVGLRQACKRSWIVRRFRVILVLDRVDTELIAYKTWYTIPPFLPDVSLISLRKFKFLQCLFQDLHFTIQLIIAPVRAATEASMPKTGTVAVWQVKQLIEKTELLHVHHWVLWPFCLSERLRQQSLIYTDRHRKQGVATGFRFSWEFRDNQLCKDVTTYLFYVKLKNAVSWDNLSQI
jgi:hypothetical protein